MGLDCPPPLFGLQNSSVFMQNILSALSEGASVSAPQQKHSSLKCSRQEKSLATGVARKTTNVLLMGLAHRLITLTKREGMKAITGFKATDKPGHCPTPRPKLLSFQQAGFLGSTQASTLYVRLRQHRRKGEDLIIRLILYIKKKNHWAEFEYIFLTIFHNFF